jgi:magnesium and cobalt exporter, CNNM family
VPKAIALQNPTQTLLYTILPMQWSLRAYAWLIVIFNGSGNLILRLFRVQSTGHRHVHSPEEIALLFAESRDGGLLEPHEQVRLHRALRLGLRDARQLMVPRARLAAIDLTTPWGDVLRIVATSPYSRLPVFRGTLDDIVGILHTKSVVAHFVAGPQPGTLARLVRPVQRVPETMSADRLLAFLRERRSHQALVVDAADRVVGLITLEDVLGELLGSVPDEFKTQRLLPIRLSDGRVRLPGELPLERARIWIEGAWPTENLTVGEFVAREARRVPRPAERLEIWELPVEIESVENGSIASVIVSPPPAAESTGEDKGEAR